MANATVVDQLIVKLGLDPKDFTKGEKEVAASVIRTKETVRKGAKSMSEEMGDAANSFARSGGAITKVFSRGGAVGIAIAATLVAGKKVNDMLYGVAEDVRRLGLDSKNFNVAAGNLRNMGNAAELAGGSIEDATNSAGGLAKSLYDLRFNGQISDSLVMLGRLGVRFQDASGKARDFKAVTLDTAEALARLQAEGRMSSSDAFMAAQQAGFTGGMANLVVQGRGAVEAELARQEARRQVSSTDTQAADKWVRSSISKSQAALAEVGVPLMTKDAGINSAVNEKFEQGITGGVRFLGDAADKASEALGELADNAREVARNTVQGVRKAFSSAQNMRGALYRPIISQAASRYGVRADVLAGIARTESGFDPNAIAKDKSGTVTGKGIMQLNPKYFPNAGENTTADINEAAKHMRGLLDSFEGTEQEKYIHALRAYHAGETNYRQGTNLGPVNAAYAGKVLSGTGLDLSAASAANSGGDTNVTIGKVDIVTQATDSEGIARDFAGNIRRKLNAAQADTGVN